MQAQLTKVGIHLNLTVVDHATMHDPIRKDVNPLVVYVAFRPTADAYLAQFFHSDAIVVTGKNPNANFAHYELRPRCFRVLAVMLRHNLPPTWGNMIRDGIPVLLADPWLSLFPGLAVLLAVLGFTLLSDSLS